MLRSIIKKKKEKERKMKVGEKSSQSIDENLSQD